MPADQALFDLGHRGLVGSAIVRRLRAEGYGNILTATSKELDLREQAAVREVREETGLGRPAYDPLVAVVELRDGELVLIDAGCEYELYASDITRTFPVSGTFSGVHRALYEIVLAANQAAIEACRV